MKKLCFLLLLLATSVSWGQAMKLGGYLLKDEAWLFVLQDPKSRETSPWLKLGQMWRGYTLTSFDPADGRLVFSWKESVSTESPAAPDNDGYQERLITVRGRVSAGFASKSFEKFILTTNEASYRLDWSAGSIHEAPLLQPGHEYEFVLVEHSFPRKYGSNTWHSIWRVSLGGRVLFDSEMCEVHHLGLQSKEVPTTHGLSRPRWSLETRRDYFPHAESARIVSCEGYDGEPPMTKIYVCQECERAYLEWQSTNAK